MAKAIKKASPKKPVKSNSIAVNGSFLDIMKAAGKQAKKRSAKK
ncbi:MAG: hypothetical protein ABI402_17310 [Ferruginibacter sp.]